MRVAFIAEILIKEFDGASRTMFQLIERIPSEGMDFRFFCGMAQENLEAVTLPTLKVPGNETYRFVVPWGGKLEKELDGFQPDVIHIATPSLLGNAALKYARKKGIPVISIYHTHFISYMDYYLKKAKIFIPLGKWYIRRSYQNFYNHCDLIYVPSISMIQELSHLGIQKSRMKLWQRGIDLSLFSPEKRNPSLLPQNSKKTILFSSRLVWEKNLKTLIDLYVLLEKEGMPYHLLIAGSGVAEEEAKKAMPQATFLGHISHDLLSKYYASSDVFIFPSVTETFGNVVLEAMASGLPSVVARGGGSKDFIIPGENGYLVEPNDAKEYLFFIKEILSDEELHKKLSVKAVQMAKSYDWEALAATYFEDLKSLKP